MAKKTLLLLLLLAFSVSVASGLSNPGPDWKPPRPRNCNRPGEVWKTCVMQGCAEKTCENKERMPCLATCDSGCYCADGFFRNRRGRCVRSCNSRANSNRENWPGEWIELPPDYGSFSEEEPISDIIPHRGRSSRSRRQRRPQRRPKPKRETEWGPEDVAE
ncbi:hypothetical protein MTO96_048028 [Rhipicephalus appendiculatus]